MLCARLGSYALPLVWTPAWLTAVSSFGVWAEGSRQFALLFGGVLFHDHRHPHLHQHQQRRDPGATLGADLASLENCPKRSLRASNGASRDCLLTFATRAVRSGYPPVVTAISPRAPRGAAPVALPQSAEPSSPPDA